MRILRQIKQWFLNLFLKNKFNIYDVQGKQVFVSCRDKNIFEKRKWHLIPSRARKQSYYVASSIKGKTIYLHREIMSAKKGEVIDHKNRNPLDCRRTNLRFATHAQNTWNRSIAITSATGYKCVYIKKGKKHKNKYYALISSNKKQHFLGYYDNPIDASNAYNKKAIELFGEFAYIN